MQLLKKIASFFKKNTQIKKDDNKTNNIGKNTTCPYCGADFGRKVKKKSKCKSCGNFVYKRTLTNGKEVIITEKEKNKLDEKLNIYYGLRDSGVEGLIRDGYLQDPEFANNKTIKKLLKKGVSIYKIGIEISNIIILNYKKGDINSPHIGHVRNAYLTIAKCYIMLENYPEALNNLYKVIVLDYITGSTGHYIESPKREMICCNLEYINKKHHLLLKTLQIDNEEAFQIYKETAIKMKNKFNLGEITEQTFEVFKQELNIKDMKWEKKYKRI